MERSGVISKMENFMVITRIFSKKKENIQEELRRVMEDKEYIMETYGGGTEGYKGERMNWGMEKRNWISK